MRSLLLWTVVWSLTSCATDLSGAPGDSPGTEAPPYEGPGSADLDPYASEVVEFVPGSEAGFGQDLLPGIVLGPPSGKGPVAGTTDVLSLGMGGEVVVGFGGRRLLDGPGVDLVIFENAFWVGMDPETPFAELGEVSVSPDGDTWHTFPCSVEAESAGQWPGCAGWQPTEGYDPDAVRPLWPPWVGGDGFDFADLGVDEVRYVRIRDLSTEGAPPSAGFDLDAVGGVHVVLDP